MTVISEYLDYGLALVPIPHGQKGPNTTGWNLSRNVLTDPRQSKLVKANVGLAHAYCTPTPTAALDIDNKNIAVDWLRQRGVELDLLLNALDAVQILSGRENRAKLLYRLPVGMEPLPTKQFGDAASRHMILEFRCASANGRTAQDVLPPSIHPETNLPYQWGGEGNWRNLPTMPEALLAIWLAASRSSGSENVRPQEPVSCCKAADDTPRQRAFLAKMLGHISADCGYDQYRNIVWSILSIGWHDRVRLAEQWCMSAADRFDAGSFNSLVKSHNEARSPTIGTIRHFALAGGWHE